MKSPLRMLAEDIGVGLIAAVIVHTVLAVIGLIIYRLALAL